MIWADKCLNFSVYVDSRDVSLFAMKYKLGQ